MHLPAGNCQETVHFQLKRLFFKRQGNIIVLWDNLLRKKGDNGMNIANIYQNR